mmetsp:Transcript_53336/g.116913  ORF Transcript_53336/g.116913 Transcript_53336/m.116913 type:complete len:488 (-) Transcript_53336:156-1619(-)
MTSMAQRPAVVATGNTRSSEVLEEGGPDPDSPTSPTKRLRRRWGGLSLSEPAPSAIGSGLQLARYRASRLSPDLPQVAAGRGLAGCCTLRFSPDGSLLAGGFFDGGLRIYSKDGAKMLHCLNLEAKEGGTPTQPAAEAPAAKGPSAGGKLKWQAAAGLARGDRGSDDKWKEASAAASSAAKKMYKTPTTNVRWWPGGHKAVVAAVEGSGMVKLWEIPQDGDDVLPACIGSANAGSALNAVAFTCEGDQLVVGGREKTIKVYDISTSSWFPSGMKTYGGSVPVAGTIVGHSLNIASLCTNPTNPDVVISVGTDKTILTWDLRCADKPVGSIYDKELVCGCDSVDISSDGNRLITGVLRGMYQLKIHDVRMPEQNDRHQYEAWGDRNTPTAMYQFAGDVPGAASTSSCLIASVSWDSKTNTNVVTAGQSLNLARAFKISRNPSEPLKVIGTLEDGEAGFMSTAMAPSGKCAAFGSNSGTVHIVDVQSKG